ncbi:MAG: phenylpyruvate tautomerase PptA (4-oxalocrotonate tautomerase family) [Verrucomicrobiales bacterium]|jgi:phenylpyruvate tautomerase PptA (4-oxalocrotonate tautomerase family)
MQTRRFFISLTGATAAAGFSRSQAQDDDSITWHDVEDWGVEGRGWIKDERERFYDRFPARAKGKVRDAVWNLSRHSSGMAVRFNSSATTIHVRYTLLSGNLAMPHMPATGVSGVDLYAIDSDGDWRWVNVTRPAAKEVNTKIASGLDAGDREFLAYFPLYNGVDKIEFGVAKGSKFEPVAPRTDQQLLFYGTSITHGACASRPGMCHPAILGRKLGMPVLNLGFSGNGRMEMEVAEFLAEENPAVYILDCLPNITADVVAKNTEPVVKHLRKARPETPIVLVEDRTYDYAWIKKSLRERHSTSRAALRKAYENLLAGGMKKLFYIEGADLLGKDGDGTTDGSHPNDLGFLRQAEAMLPVLKQALGKA